MPFVKMSGKCAGGLAMQLKGETAINMYCMLMPGLLMKAEDMFPSLHFGCRAIDKPIVDSAAAPVRVTGGGYR